MGHGREEGKQRECSAKEMQQERLEIASLERGREGETTRAQGRHYCYATVHVGAAVTTLRETVAPV